MINLGMFGCIILGILCLVVSTILFLYFRKRNENFVAFKTVLTSIRERKINTFDDLCYLKRDVNQLINNQGDNAYDYCLEDEWQCKFKYKILALILIMFAVIIAYMNIDINFKFYVYIVMFVFYLLMSFVMNKVETTASKYVNKEIEEYLSDPQNISNYLKSVDNVKD